MSEPKELRNVGLKATHPRLKILAVFQEGKQRHMSAEDVYRELMQVDHDIGLATVYRVLNQFEQAGILKRSVFETGDAVSSKVYELDEGEHHDHLVCLQCGRVEEFFDSQIEARQAEVANERGFELQDHALALYANCTRKNCPHAN
ncbi:MAG: ferric iron uptake transcriptional regulator [Burkholderiaceae bacterium]